MFNSEGLKWLLIFLGGGLGSICRYAFSTLNEAETVSFYWGTLTANAISCLVLGILTAYLQNKTEQNYIMTAALVGMGFCGGFSTFSTFSKEVSQLVINQKYILAISYLFISLLTGIVLYYVGLIAKFTK